MVRKVALKAGVLNEFPRLNTLHRVVPLKGQVERLFASLACFDHPRVEMTGKEQQDF
jgi:hypothetical protein